MSPPQGAERRNECADLRRGIGPLELIAIPRRQQIECPDSVVEGAPNAVLHQNRAGAVLLEFRIVNDDMGP